MTTAIINEVNKLKMIDSSTNLLNLPLNSIPKDRLLKTTAQMVLNPHSKGLYTIATLNPEQVVQADSDDQFRSVLSQFSVRVADGVGIVWASQFLTGKKVPRIPGVELAEALVKLCLTNEQKVMLIGGQNGVAEQAGKYLSNQYQSTTSHKQLIFVENGAQDITSQSAKENNTVIARIAQVKPSLILVAYGAPHQEIWIQANRDSLEKAGIKVAMVVGGAFDYWSGNVPRAPLWLRHLGFEWLYRLIHQPWRWRRQLRLIQFVWLVIKEKTKG